MREKQLLYQEVLLLYLVNKKGVSLRNLRDSKGCSSVAYYKTSVFTTLTWQFVFDALKLDRHEKDYFSNFLFRSLQ